jgi:hypothetical protein
LEFGELAKKTAGRVEPGDRLVVELPVVATWPDMGKVTVTIAGTRFTFAENNPEIREVLKKAKEKAGRGQQRVGGSDFVFDEARGRSGK